MLTQYVDGIKGLNLQQAQLALSTRILTDEQKKQILAKAGLKASEDIIQAELVQSALLQQNLNKEKQEEILIELGLMDRKTRKLLVDKSCNAEILKATLAQELKNKTDERGILSTLGLGEANLFTAETFKLLGLQAKNALLAIAKNPLTWIVVGIAGFIAIIDLCSTSVKEHEEELENLNTEYSEIKSELDGLNNELQTTQNRIAELESKDKLTFTEGEELENLKKQNNELQRSIDLTKLKEKEATDLYKEYASLMSKSDAYGLTADEKESLLKISNDLVDTYGLEVQGIDAVTGAYIIGANAINDYVEALRTERLEKQKEQTDARNKRIKKNIKEAKKGDSELVDETTANKASNSFWSPHTQAVNLNKKYGKDSFEEGFFDIYEDRESDNIEETIRQRIKENSDKTNKEIEEILKSEEVVN